MIFINDVSYINTHGTIPPFPC